MKRLKRDDINLLEAYTYKTPLYEKFKPHLVYFFVPFLFVCLCVVVYIFGFARSLHHDQLLLNRNKEELSSLKSTSEDLMSASDYQAYIDNKNTYDVLKEMKSVIDTYPRINQKALSKLMENHDTITSIAYNQDDHSMTIQYKVDQQSFYYNLITKMRKTGYFSDIEYVGYTGVDDQVTSQNMTKYASTIIYKLK